MGECRAYRICQRILDALVSVTLAPHCAACARVLEAPLEGPVCSFCWASIPTLPGPFCRTCGDPLPSWRVISAALARCPRCRRRPGLIASARTAGDYDGALRDIIHAFKYEGRRGLARPLGVMMRAAGAELLRDADLAVPVPLHPWRRLRRGFNQAEDLARRLDIPVLPALMRVRPTAPQMGLTAAARRRNVRGAFRVSPIRRRIRQRLEGANVVLVDDVRTTGATLEACAGALVDAGVREVRALTAARRAVTAGADRGL